MDEVPQNDVEEEFCEQLGEAIGASSSLEAFSFKVINLYVHAELPL